MDEKKYIQTGTKENLFIITMNRPERGNALNLEMLDQLYELFMDIEENPEIQFVLIKANGKTFCSGADLEWMAKAADLTEDENLSECMKLADMYSKIANCSKICIAQVQGPCIGGGLGLLAACDFVFATEDSFFSFSEVKLGLAPATIAPFVIDRIGWHKARNLMLSGMKITSEMAFQTGLIDFLCNQNDLEEKVTGFLNELQEGEIHAQRTIKFVLRELKNKKAGKDSTAFTAGVLADIRKSQFAREGIHAFLNKRTPDWKKF